MLVVITGPTCSGKSTLANQLQQQGFERIVTYTTRPIRPGEKDGVDYNFVSEECFRQMIDEDMFAEWRTYDTVFSSWLYGSTRRSYESSDRQVIVISPESAAELYDSYLPTKVIYTWAPEELLRSLAVLRGDDESEVDRRLRDDRMRFKAFEESGKFDYKLDLRDHLVDLA